MSHANRRYYRTLALGVAAMAALVWAAVDQFGIPWGEIRGLFLTTLLLILAVILCSAASVALWVGLRRLFGGNSRRG